MEDQTQDLIDRTRSLPHFLQQQILGFTLAMRQRDEKIRMLNAQLKMLLQRERDPNSLEYHNTDPQSPIKLCDFGYHNSLGLNKEISPFQGVGEEENRVFFVAGPDPLPILHFDEITSFEIQVFPYVLNNGRFGIDVTYVQSMTIDFYRKQIPFWTELKQQAFWRDRIEIKFGRARGLSALERTAKATIRRDDLILLLNQFPGTAFLLDMEVAIVAKPF